MVNPLMNFEPKLERSNPGYDWILKEIATLKPFYFLKLNHGFWERLVQIQKLGYELADIGTLEPNEISEIEKKINAEGIGFFSEGFLDELLDLFNKYRFHSHSFIFVSSLQPWPLSDRVEGTPLQSSSKCMSLISQYVPAELIEESSHKGFTGYEFKKAIIDNDLTRFFQVITSRKVIVLCNQRNRAIFDHLMVKEISFILVHERQARLKRHELFDELIEEVAQSDGEPPIVVSMVGGALATWLGFKLNDHQANCQYIDVGAAFYAFVEGDAGKRSWMKAYASQLSNAINSMNLPPEITRLYSPDKSKLSNQVIALANSNGVNEPHNPSVNARNGNSCIEQVGFMENKTHNLNRLADYLDISANINHYVNGSRLVNLLENAFHLALDLPANRHVVVVNSRTSAFFLAAEVNQVVSGKSSFRWLTSEFSFVPAGRGSIGTPVLAPCDAQGRLDLNALANIPADTYDGVIYTNLFAQHSNWTDLFSWCQANEKAMIVDNSTGLFDRPAVNLQAKSPIEIIACDHTMPWGIGEGGILICNEEEAYIARKLANTGTSFNEKESTLANLGANYRLSDLAASAILCRLETFESWSFFYKSQERRVKSLVIDSELPLIPLKGQTEPRSVLAFTPFISKFAVSIIGSGDRNLSQKYCKPIVAKHQRLYSGSKARRLYEHLVCISNNPFNRNISNEDYSNLLKSSLIFQKD